MHTGKNYTGLPQYCLLVLSSLQGKIWVEKSTVQRILFNETHLPETTVMLRELPALNDEPSSPALTRPWCTQQHCLVDRAPVAAITWHQPSSDKQNEVNKPPDSKSSKRQQLPNGCARVSQTEAINPETAQEEGVE